MSKHLHYGLLLVTSQVLFAGATPSPTNWSGFYFGPKVAAVFSKFNANTRTQTGPMFTPAEARSVNRTGNQKLNTRSVLAGIEGGYNWQFKQFLLGLETDLQSLSTNALQYSAPIPYQNGTEQFVITSYADNNWLFTLRPRLGLMANNWLLYATGGLSLALLHSDFLYTDSLGAFESQRVHKLKPGYAVGAGVETSVTRHVSLKTEYLFTNFNNTNATAMNQTIPPGQSFLNRIGLQSSMISFGLNYHVDEQLSTSMPFNTDQWQTEIGARLFFSSGLAGAPQPLLNTSPIGNILASRLTFSNMSATTEEVFARLDHASGLFLKGYLGAGSAGRGQLNDEDFPAGEEVYSNTFSNAWGNISYGTIDLGYTLLKNVFGSAGAFIGYNYYAQNFNIYNCQQLAGSSTCVPGSELTNFLALSEDDTFNSLRLGLASEFRLTKRWSLASEAAYLPLVHFRGLDMHNARELVGPETSNNGDGSMLEAILKYQLNDSWNMGLGGRYWTWNMHNGSLLFDFLGANELIEEPARFNAERYGVFLQVSYRNGEAHDLQKDSGPVHWSGLFAGGTLGGAWSYSTWSDPFGATLASDGYVNVAGFGDHIRSSGPLAGLDLHINWQTGRLVYGVAGTISGADIRGENTIFSGIGGNNGQEKSTYLATLVGRIGTPFERSLVYLNAGRAVLNTQYSVTGNTGILNLGLGSQTLSTWGWTGGVGVEYAITDSWNTSVEYDYIRIPNQNLAFPGVELVNQQQISAHRNVGVFKLGVNYKLL